MSMNDSDPVSTFRPHGPMAQINADDERPPRINDDISMILERSAPSFLNAKPLGKTSNLPLRAVTKSKPATKFMT